MWLRNVLLSLMVIFFAACKSDEPLIDYTSDSFELMVSIDETNPKLSIINFPDGSIDNDDIYLLSNNEKLPGAVKRIAEFRDSLYLFIPDKYQIIVLDKKTYKKAATIDFSADTLEPWSVCFPNATTGYVTHKNSPVVSVIDLTTCKICKKITVGKYPVSVASYGNKVFTANYADNTVSVIDTRTNEVTATIDVSPCPAYVDISYDGNYAYVISLGNGKIDTTQTKTAAVSTAIAIATNTIFKTKEIGTTTQKAVDQVPYGFATANNNYGFIPSVNYMFRIETKKGETIATVNKQQFRSVIYNYKRNELFLVRINNGNYEAVTAGTSSADVKLTMALPQNYITILPM